MTTITTRATLRRLFPGKSGGQARRPPAEATVPKARAGSLAGAALPLCGPGPVMPEAMRGVRFGHDGERG
ncbi:hypothetical protein [Caldovatus aquaticus]|uniref:Uncharacterized protein n=1 Tax=Caldovatus aquaticus TaxID=2865671 RepID=A0ABS7EZW5_9PROT|nr:hypothetical protein [Caldovatus aquaticus]MBW8268905.1 hypothetical protein [Caldovatus aquaticus]